MRALYGRVANLGTDQVSHPYQVYQPFIEGISDSKIVINVKPGKSCMNWVIGESDVEFINTKTGKTSEEEDSRLCKANIFSKFMAAFNLFGNLEGGTTSTISYHAYKESASQYQQLKQVLLDYLENNGRGKWVQKPQELDLFFVKDMEKSANTS
jgi:hypothetical protein